jgi:O-antigen/teichoic acid export membrane protein
MDGAFWLLIANAYHGLVGFAIFVVAARSLTEAEFGALSLATAVALAAEELVKLGAPKAASREVARSLTAKRRDGAVALAMRLNLATGLGLTALFAAASPGLASAMGEPTLWAMLAVTGIDMFVFAPYTVYGAAINGSRRFKAQAALMMTYSSAKALAVVGCLLATRSPWGGVAGYLIGSSTGSLLGWFAWRVVKQGETSAGADGTGSEDAARPKLVGSIETGAAEPPPPTTRSMFAFSAPMALFGFLAAIFLNVDLMAFKALGARVGAESATWASEVGWYTGAMHIARMAYFVFLAFGEALFPSLTRSLAHEAPALGAERVRKACGQLLELLIPALALGLATGSQVAALIFGEGFERGGPYLSYLLPTVGLLAIFNLLASALAAAGEPWRVFAAVAAGLALNGGANSLGWTTRPVDPPLAALIASGAMVAALLPALVRRFGGAWIPWRRLAMALAGGAIMWFAGRAIRDAGWPMFLWGGLAFGVVWGAQVVVEVAGRKKNGYKNSGLQEPDKKDG